MVSFSIKKFKRLSVLVPGLALALALFSTGLGLLSASSPIEAQQVNTNFQETTASLNFRLRVDGGVEPVLTIDVGRSRYCLGSDGGAVAGNDNLGITLITHERVGTETEVCTHDVYINFFGFNSCTATVIKPGTNVDLSLSTSAADGFRVLRVSGSGTPNFVSGRGDLKAIDNAGSNISGGDDLESLIVTVDDCVLGNPSSGNSFYVVNPEPEQSMRARFVGVRGCSPRGGGTLEFDLRGLEREFVTLNTDCNWDFHFEDVQNSCSAIAAIYTEGNDEPALVTGTSRTPDTARLNSFASSNRREGESIAFNGNRVRMISIFRTDNCTEVLQAFINIRVPQGLEDVPVRVQILPSNARNTESCSTFTVTVTGNTPQVVFLRRRQRFSTQVCRYVFRPEQVAGALELANTELAEQSFDVSRGRLVTLLDYTTKQIPIQLHTVFPSQVFTTEDKVAFRIYSPGACGSASSTLGGVLGAGVGVHRTFPVHPRTTQLLGREATTVGSEPPYVYTMPPTILTRDIFSRETEQDCSVTVDLVSGPSGCSLVGNRSKTVSANKDSTSYDFFFVFSCRGEQGVQTTPSEPPTPQNPNADPADLSEFILRLQRGWKMFAYNGADGATPADFIGGTNIRSIWAWDQQGQTWLGYEDGRVDSLKRLTKGQPIFMFIPVETDLILRPGGLLSVVGNTTSVTLAPGYSLIAYSGPDRTTASAFNSDSVKMVLRWDSDNQDWEVYYSEFPSRNTLKNVKKGDLLFVFSSASGNIRVTY